MFKAILKRLISLNNVKSQFQALTLLKVVVREWTLKTIKAKWLKMIVKYVICLIPVPSICCFKKSCNLLQTFTLLKSVASRIYCLITIVANLNYVFFKYFKHIFLGRDTTQYQSLRWSWNLPKLSWRNFQQNTLSLEKFMFNFILHSHKKVMSTRMCVTHPIDWQVIKNWSQMFSKDQNNCCVHWVGDVTRHYFIKYQVLL